MLSRIIIITSIAAHLVVADRLSTWLSDMCTNANMGSYEPLERGTCYEFGQAQSFILTKDNDNVYNLYGGGGCGQYEGQVSLGGICSQVGDGITGIMNIGPQSAKRWIRGGEPMGKRSITQSTPWAKRKWVSSPTLVPKKRAVTMINGKRVEGDTFQCPVPSGADYFFVVTTSSAAHADTFEDEERIMTNDFMARFNEAYQNPSGQTQVSSNTVIGGVEIPDVQLTIEMNQGVIQDIQPQDMENLTRGLLAFRDAQTDPVRFVVGLYTGRVDQPGAGLIANFDFNGD